jgi:hypothetical protein
MPETELVRVTYREIAERFDIGIEGARLKAKRRAAKGLWRIIPGNHPQDPIRIEMPAADFSPSNTSLQRGGSHSSGRGTPTGLPPQTPNSRDPNDLVALVEVVSRLTAQTADLTERLLQAEQGKAGAETEAAVARERADGLQAQLEGLRTVLDIERRQAGELRREHDHALERISRHVADLARAEHDRDRAAEALAAHLALPWWRRLFG